MKYAIFLLAILAGVKLGSAPRAECRRAVLETVASTVILMEEGPPPNLELLVESVCDGRQ